MLYRWGDGNQRQIRQGFEAVEAALATAPEEDRERLAPFFRFPGLNDSSKLIRWLGERNIATFSCEFGADDFGAVSSGTALGACCRPSVRS